MTRRQIVWLVGVAALALASGFALSGSLLAQKVIAGPDDESINVVVGGEGSWLGVSLSDVNAEKARAMKLPGEYGAIVNHVDEDSPAAKAGLKEHDVILEYNGQKVWSVAELSRMVRETPPDRKVPLEVSRDGATLELTATLERHQGMHGFNGGAFVWPPNMPEIPNMELRGFGPDFGMEFGMGPALGVTGEALTPQLATYFGVEGGKGVLVREVMADTPAQKAGLKAGDCIVRVGSTDIESLQDLRQALREQTRHATGGKSQINLTIVRNHQQQTVSVTLDAPIRRSTERAELTPDGVAAEINALSPKARAKIEQRADELRRQIESEVGKIQDQAARSAEADAMAREMRQQADALRQQWAGQSDAIRQRVQELEQNSERLKNLQKQFQPEMERLRKELEQEMHQLAIRSSSV